MLLLVILCSFDAGAQAWEQVNNSPFRDDHTNGFGFEGKAYVFRGTPTTTPGGDQANEVWQYDPTDDSWTMLTYFPGPSRRISIGDDWDGKYYYGFGIGGPDGRLSDLWVFDPVDTSFTELPSCPCIGRSHPSLIAHNDKIFMGAGSSGNGDVKDWWEYDIPTQVWSQKEDIPGGNRHHMFHFSSGKYVYVGGGHVANWNQYDPETEEWTAIDDLPAGRVAGTQFNHNGLGFILGGDDASHNHVPDFETFMFYDPEVKEWDYLPPLPNGSRWAPSSFIIGDDLYFMAGLSDIVNNDASMWKFDLSLLECLPASDLSVMDVDDTSAGLFWNTNSNSEGETLQWRKVGDQIWNIVPNAEAVYQLSDLEVCQDYEFKVIKQCGDMSTISELFVFRTDGCCINPEIVVSTITPTSALVEWPEISAAQEYRIRWKETETVDWSTEMVSEGPYELTNLKECTEYEFQIESVCLDEDIEYSESALFYTRGCGACLDIDYCSVEERFGSDLVFINKVEINNYVNESGNNDGYSNFEGALAEEVLAGEPMSFTFEPGFLFEPIPFDLVVWIDLDGNGSFEDSEMVIFEEFLEEEITKNVLIPANSTLGVTRMRVYFSNTQDPCALDDIFLFGEAEDYCVNLVDELTSVSDLSSAFNSLEVLPNPFQNKFVLRGKIPVDKNCDFKIVDISGKVVQKMNNHKIGDAIVMSDEISAGIYFLIVENEEEVKAIKIVKQ